MGIQWRESLSIGVSEIDSQHKELINRFAAFQQAGTSGKGFDEIRELMSFLEEYVHSHFKDEEALQILSHYPAFEAHRSEHVYFIDQLEKLKQELVNDGVTPKMFVDTGNVLTKWLLNHICSIDMEFSAYLKLHKNNHEWSC